MPTNLQQATRPREADSVAHSAHPADSSRILMSLLALVRQADPEAGVRGPNPYGDLISPSVLRSLLSALHYRDEGTVYHGRRVALGAVGMARELGWDEEELRVLEIAALLHDVGKIGVPDSILHKPAALSADEAELVAQNHNVGLTILQACRIDNNIVEIVAQAARASLPNAAARSNVVSDAQQGGRILAVADMYDSLIHDQSYRGHLSSADALSALVESERQLDRNVIAALRRWLADGGQALLADDRQAGHSIRASAPIDEATVAHAGALCHAFAYLYVLESLYDAYYIVDSDLRLVVCSHGLSRVLPGARFIPGEAWSRRLVGGIDESGKALPDSAYPLMKVLETNRAQCATLRLPATDSDPREIEFHALPVQDAQGRLHGVAEIVRDNSHSQRNAVLYKELRQAANQDPLTGIANRGQLETRLADLYSDFQRGGCSEPFCIVFVDIDHFKRINDTHDHVTGDQVLINLVRLLEDELYSGETVGRYGGEEFLILCPGTPLEQAVKRADRVRRAIQNARFAAGHHIAVTASLGVAQVMPHDTIESALQRADQALFDAKRSGRNRTCFRAADETGAEARAAVHQPAGRGGEFIHTAKFVACKTEDILVFKMKGFVQDHQARLLEVRSNLVAMQVGQRTMLRRWGAHPDRQPVELIVSLGEPEVARKSGARRVMLEVTLTPVGSPPDMDAFRSRASRIVELLKSHLLAD